MARKGKYRHYKNQCRRCSGFFNSLSPSIALVLDGPSPMEVDPCTPSPFYSPFGGSRPALTKSARSHYLEREFLDKSCYVRVSEALWCLGCVEKGGLAYGISNPRQYVPLSLSLCHFLSSCITLCYSCCITLILVAGKEVQVVPVTTLLLLDLWEPSSPSVSF